MLKKTSNILIVFLTFLGVSVTAVAQPKWTLDPFGKEKKPEKYENRKLGSEKTADKKFTRSRRMLQNTITHYNYYFNANNKLNGVVERAKITYKDDYTKLLPYYPFTLESTAAQKQELDSVIYKCTAGILLHDLRNDWIDNLYLLISKAYYLRKDFDSAAMTLQFINYNLFPRKKNEDDSRVIGTNAAASGNNISIANTEKQPFLQKMATPPPSRNDALVWLARTLIEQNEFGESAGLINTLQNDANLPTRLRNDLEEINAYWFYRQEMYDSTAVHLEKAITNADDKQDKSRREFLLAQLYELNGETSSAEDFYARASKHTVNPLLDIYAQLNSAKMQRNGGNEKELSNSISNLLKMAKKDKFEPYRDIIYYSAGQLAMQLPDSAAAIVYFNKSIEKNENNTAFRNKAYLQLGDIAFKRKAYKLAAAMYDSLITNDTTIAADLARIAIRRSALGEIVQNLNIIETQDSLQRIAALTPAEREDFIKKLVRKMRKESGFKEDVNNSGAAAFPDAKNAAPLDLFASSGKGEWYFYNNAAKSRGFNEFKSKWGSRINADNWRRKSALDASLRTAVVLNTPNGNTAASNAPAEITYESLMENLPNTPEKIDSSNSSIAASLLSLADTYQNKLEDYEEAAKTYEEYLRRFPEKLADGDVYLGLHFCYKKLGDLQKADYYKNLLNTKFNNTKAWQTLNTPAAISTKSPEATKLYDGIYNLFIEGKFDDAIAEKKKADTKYGVNYWTPQLLLIEALHHVHLKNDSVAIAGLNTLMQTYPNSPLKEKASTMIDVLKRRKEIEQYLTNLQVNRAEEEMILVSNDDNTKTVTKAPVVVAPAAPKLPVAAQPIIIKDTLKTIPVLKKDQYEMQTEAPHLVIMILDKVDGVYINEAKNAFNRFNKENFYGMPLEISKDVLDADRQLLVTASFANGAAALEYYEKIKRSAAREVSWLPANKYAFLIITKENLEVLKTKKDIAGYKALLNTLYPNKF